MENKNINEWLKKDNFIYLISEVANSHQGKIKLLNKTIEQHKFIKSNAIKFQVFFKDELIPSNHKSKKIFDKLYFSKENWIKTLKKVKRDLDKDLICDIYGYE